MVLHHEEKDPRKPEFSGFRFKSLHLANVAWTENKDGIADKLFHKYEWTLRQMKEKWQALPDKLEKLYQKDQELVRKLLMSVYPDDGIYKVTFIDTEAQVMLDEIEFEELS